MKSGNIVSWDEAKPAAEGIIAPTETKTTGTPGGLAFAIMVASSVLQAIWVRVSSITGGRRFTVYVLDTANGQWDDFRTTMNTLALAGTGVQVYQRVGEDGRICEFTALGRTYPTPTGGTSGLETAVDLLPSRRMNLGAILDKILDMPACKGVYVDQEESVNPDGNVYAFDETRAADLNSDLTAEPTVVLDVLDAVAPSADTGNPGAFI